MVGITPLVRLRCLPEEVSAVLGARGEGAELLPGAREGVPGLACLVERGDGRCGGLLEVRLPLPAAAEQRPDRVTAGLQRGLGRRVPLEPGTQGHELVGEQARPRVPHRELHLLGPPGDLGLLPERGELPAQLPREIGQPCEVRLHRVELPHGLLAPAAVLEDSRGLLDEAPPFLGCGVQHLVQLALADDDVHLAAQSGVGEEFLDVEEPAAPAVDGVLGAARPEERAGDRHLGVLDGQGAVGVVDGERHLGAPERGPAGRPGEDDVLHPAAAERLGPLLAHDPRERVDDVGLPGPVGPDDGGDARLEVEGGCRGERLEPSHG